MMQPLLRISYPQPLTREQEDVLISYFQAWQRTFSDAFRRSAFLARPVNAELAGVLQNAAGNMSSMMSLEACPGGYLFLFDDLLFNAAQLPLPKELQEKMKLTNENRMEKLRTRFMMDLTGDVAKRMKVPHVKCADV